MSKRVTLESFVANLRADVGAFETMWRREREKNPKNWPATQPSTEDWQEQFLAWYEMRETSIATEEPK